MLSFHGLAQVNGNKIEESVENMLESRTDLKVTHCYRTKLIISEIKRN